MKQTDVGNLSARTVTGLARLAVVFGDILRKFSTRTPTESAFLARLDDVLAEGTETGVNGDSKEHRLVTDTARRGLHD